MTGLIACEKSKTSVLILDPEIPKAQPQVETPEEEILKQEPVKLKVPQKLPKKEVKVKPSDIKVSKKIFYIQLGAFKELENVNRLEEKVKSFGYTTRKVKVRKILTAVQVRPFDKYDKAKDHVEKLFERLHDEELNSIFINHYNYQN